MKAAVRVLMIEDEARIVEFAQAGLALRGFVVKACLDGHAGFDAACKAEHDVVVLDLMLPGRDGLSVLTGMRAAGVNTPVILLTARNALSDRVAGLDLGADDYLAKPFFVEELAARIQALLRRRAGDRQNTLQVGSVQLDRLSRQVSCGGHRIDLTTREFNLIEYLMRSAGQLLTRTQILEHVWGYDFDTGTNVVDSCVMRIRKKMAGINSSLDAESLIESVRGVGYRFKPAP